MESSLSLTNKVFEDEALHFKETDGFQLVFQMFSLGIIGYHTCAGMASINGLCGLIYNY